MQNGSLIYFSKAPLSPHLPNNSYQDFATHRRKLAGKFNQAVSSKNVLNRLHNTISNCNSNETVNKDYIKHYVFHLSHRVSDNQK